MTLEINGLKVCKCGRFNAKGATKCHCGRTFEFDLFKIITGGQMKDDDASREFTKGFDRE